jgi:hypothetical protein
MSGASNFTQKGRSPSGARRRELSCTPGTPRPRRASGRGSGRRRSGSRPECPTCPSTIAFRNSSRVKTSPCVPAASMFSQRSLIERRHVVAELGRLLQDQPDRREHGACEAVGDRDELLAGVDLVVVLPVREIGRLGAEGIAPLARAQHDVPRLGRGGERLGAEHLLAGRVLRVDGMPIAWSGARASAVRSSPAIPPRSRSTSERARGSSRGPACAIARARRRARDRLPEPRDVDDRGALVRHRQRSAPAE